MMGSGHAHLEEGVVARGDADVLDVGHAHALLRGRRARHACPDRPSRTERESRQGCPTLARAHLEEGVVAHGDADVLDVGHAHALLRGRRARHACQDRPHEGQGGGAR